MANTTSLHLFPAPAPAPIPQSLPRKSSLKKPPTTYVKSSVTKHSNGLALRITTPGSDKSTAYVEPIQHSLFCEPRADVKSPASSDASSRPSVKKQSSISDVSLSSSLPSRDTFSPASSTSYSYHTPKSILSPGSVTSPDTSVKSPMSQVDIVTAPMRSMFPQYDPHRPLDAQQYFPRATPQPSAAPDVSRASETIEALPIKPQVDRFDSGTTLVDGYEHIPFAETNDLLLIWKASRCGAAPGARKLRLGIYQPPNRRTAIAVGRSDREILYSMQKGEAWQPAPVAATREFMFVQKHCPLEPAPFTVAQIPMPSSEACRSDRSNTRLTNIFPQMAAVDAVETAANSAAAFEIAAFDSTGSSRAATRLVQGAVTERRKLYDCELRLQARKLEALGAVVARYVLVHPVEGEFPITITKSVAKGSREPRARICLHHPSATPAALTAETLVLAFLDFGRDACVVDVPGLLAFESPYLIDLVFSTLLSVAAIESTALKARVTETMSFDAPPRASASKSRGKRNSLVGASKSKRKLFGRSKTAKKAVAREATAYDGEQVDLSGLQSAAALLGLTVKVAFALIETGVKMTAHAVSNAQQADRR